MPTPKGRTGASDEASLSCDSDASKGATTARIGGLSTSDASNFLRVRVSGEKEILMRRPYP